MYSYPFDSNHLVEPLAAHGNRGLSRRRLRDDTDSSKVVTYLKPVMGYFGKSLIFMMF